MERFKECYEKLYNSAGSEDATSLIKTKLENIVNGYIEGSMHEIHKVTGYVVKETCKRMLPGKNDVTGVYTSDVFLHGPDVLFEHLAAVFRSFLLHGTVTMQILTCAFLLLFKGGAEESICVRLLQDHCWCLTALEIV